MKGQHTRMVTGEQVHTSTADGAQTLRAANGFRKATREPGPVLMCWRAFRPEDNGDRDVESMSSAW